MAFRIAISALAGPAGDPVGIAKPAARPRQSGFCRTTRQQTRIRPGQSRHRGHRGQLSWYTRVAVLARE